MRFLGADVSQRPDEVEAQLMVAVSERIVREYDRMERNVAE